MGLGVFIRDSLFGRIVYHLSKHKYFHHPEEDKDYVIPEKYLSEFKGNEIVVGSNDSVGSASSNVTLSSDVGDGKIIVTWDGDDDPENPRNWPVWQKCLLIFLIGLLTVVVYMASAIYTPGVEMIMRDLHISRLYATLPLSMFVIGYGLGTMILSPMSENSLFGRTYIYIATLFMFFILQIPTALVNDIASLTVLRFISGLFASPALAIGGASVGDVMTFPFLPMGIGCWAISASASPSLSPLIGAVLIEKRNWHWSFWFLAMSSGIVLVLFTVLLPETFDKKLLARKAQRLRKLTGNPNIMSVGEVENSKLTVKQLAYDTLWRPIAITFFEPVVLLVDIYIALVYSIIYLWFEAFPIVFVQTFHFPLITAGATFISIIIGVLLGALFYCFYVYYKLTKPLLNGQMVHPEIVVPAMIVGAVVMPIGIFIFGWTASADLHWFPPLIGSTMFGFSAFVLFQTGFNYLSFSFPNYLASVFAGNNLFRSCIAGCFPLFAGPLFNNLATKKFPVAWGSSVLGFINIIMILVPVLFYLNGPRLRSRSKYANVDIE